MFMLIHFQVTYQLMIHIYPYYPSNSANYDANIIENALKKNCIPQYSPLNCHGGVDQLRNNCIEKRKQEQTETQEILKVA